MSKPPYLMGDSMMKSFKSKDPARKAKIITFMASVLFFFICTSIFYILNRSPNTLAGLFSNNIFWFFMSNTLILIIAADYEAFSSSKTNQDHYEDFAKHRQARNYNHYVTSSSYGGVPTNKYEPVDEKPCVVVHPKQELLQEKIKEGVPDDQGESEIVPERVLEIVPRNNLKKLSSSSEEKTGQDDSNNNKACEAKTLFPVGRAVWISKADRYNGHVKRVVTDERKNRVRRAETMKVEEARVEEENNEFSSMSNEELNRRVEEFIQRFNRQIRLQAARNNIVHEAY